MLKDKQYADALSRSEDKLSFDHVPINKEAVLRKTKLVKKIFFFKQIFNTKFSFILTKLSKLNFFKNIYAQMEQLEDINKKTHRYGIRIDPFTSKSKEKNHYKLRKTDKLNKLTLAQTTKGFHIDSLKSKKSVI